jgi:hypothetical protein
MNKIVRERYPVNRLPEDLRGDLDPSTEVTVTVESTTPVDDGVSITGLIEEVRRRTRTRFRDDQDIVEYVRRVREGGDLSPWIEDASTSTPTSSSPSSNPKSSNGN